ncbi:transcriptional repressor LexA [Rhodopirellula sp. MGV]|uniref:transcriptional repressor LexA n=1 Tax=Rhodopirellula sp. MGV TaxID=2023130 RepID=UPI000B971C0E|nr:transcriptional repressor LexA [Rhodopirellula sp. MGV]OYP34381.1 repressor LexA [Rhodopirellula sp. MGV]PNY37444.1 transcriptional repressor LexA [Rhodopirellula baltica]
MATKQLTERQRRVYELIRDLIVNRGYGPTVREIGEAFGIKSPNGVMCHLRALERKGLIRRSPNKSRAIELTETVDRGHSLPMAGMVAAGTTALAFEQSDRVDFSGMFCKNDRFILQVSGDSMIDAHIQDGDFVVIQKQESAEPGQMVVAELATGDSTLKFWFPEEGRIRLQPANREMAPLYVSDARIVGVAVGVVRNGI